MDLLISEMEKLLASGRENCDFQEIIGESAGKNIDDLLIEADKLISETLPYFQTNTNTNTALNDFSNTKINSMTKTAQLKNQQNETKKVVFNLKTNTQSTKIPEKSSKTSENNGNFATNKYIIDKESKKHNTCSSSLKNCMKPKFKVPEVNLIKTQFQVPIQVNSTLLDNHNQLKIMCNRHNKLSNNIKTQARVGKLKMEEELNYYKLKNNELEKNLMFKEQEIRDWENRYHQLSQYCESFLKKNVEETLKHYDYQLNDLIERNLTRESQLHAIIIDLLKEIDQSHLQYRIKFSEKNKEIRKYLDQIERILDNIYEFRNNNVVR
ncbi:Hypothetical protein CINCED_3A016617 [Cinara cedri]|uniref:Uncharacterized protein n=1 Tax=Cinara cedri TaxID=506608 RepID=A0A5E4MXE3_9HEMI|nr:Hypothetical protein CINCED_3A016617 [Cinara cedri]